MIMIMTLRSWSLLWCEHTPKRSNVISNFRDKSFQFISQFSQWLLFLLYPHQSNMKPTRVEIGPRRKHGNRVLRRHCEIWKIYRKSHLVLFVWLSFEHSQTIIIEILQFLAVSKEVEQGKHNKGKLIFIHKRETFPVDPCNPSRSLDYFIIYFATINKTVW